MKLAAKEKIKPRLALLSNQSFIRSMHVSTFVKFGLFSVNAYVLPNWLSICVFTFSQVQIFSIFIQTALLAYPHSRMRLRNVFVLFHKISSIIDSWSIDKLYTLTLSIVGIIGILLVIEILCMFSLILSIYISRLSFLRFEKVWSFFTNIHPRILFYPINCIGIKVLSVLHQGSGLPRLTSVISVIELKILIITFLLWNLTYSVGTLMFLSPKIKTKNLLSSHTRLIDFIDLFNKAVSPVIWYFGPDSNFLYTSLLMLNLLSTILRDGILFWFLPYYNISILKASMYFHAVITLLAFTNIIPKVISYNNPMFASLVFIMLAPLLIKLYTKHLDRILKNILADPSKVNCYHLLHYWEVFKYFGFESRNRLDEHYLYHYGSTINEPCISPIGNQSNYRDSKTASLNKKHQFELFINLLRAITQKTKQKMLLKCCLAQHYSKYQELYVLADDLVDTGVKRSSSICLKISFYLIRIELFNKVNGLGKHVHGLEQDQEPVIQSQNFQKYFQMYDSYEYLKNCIAEQLKAQIRFWASFQAQEPDSYLMLNLAKKVCSKAIHVKKGWSFFRSFSDNQFVQPFLIYGLYCSFVINDFALGDLFLQTYYSAEAKKYQETRILNKKMNMQVLYDSIHLSVSGYSSSLYKIIDCTDNIQKFLGYKRAMVLGKSINTLVPFLFPDKQTNPDASSCLNQSKEVQALDKEGYLVNCRFHAALKFFKDGMLCYYVLLHLIKDKKRVVVVRYSGKIINCSKGFQQDLGFSRKERANLNMFLMSPKLKEAAWEFMENQENTGSKKVHTLTRPTTSFPLREPLRKTVSQTPRKISLEDPGESCLRHNEDDIFFFCFPPQADTIMNRAIPRIVSYHVKFEASIMEGETILIIGLTKVSTNKKARVDSGSKAVNLSHEHEPSDFLARESVFQDDFMTPPLTLQSSRKLIVEEIIKSPRSNKVFTKHSKVQTGTEGQSDVGDEGDRFGSPVFGPSKNRHSKLNTKPVITTTFSEENEDHRLLNTVASDRLGVAPAHKVQSKGLTKFTTTTTAEDQPIKRNTLIEGIESPKETRTKKQQQFAVKPNDGDAAGVNIETSFVENGNAPSPNPFIKVKTIRLEQKKKKEEASEDNFVKKYLKDSQKLRHKAKDHKEIQEQLNNRKYKKSSVIYIIIFVLAMAVELGLLVWFNFNVLRASRDAASSSEVLQAAFFRNYWLNLADLENRLFDGVRVKWITWPMKSQLIVSNRTIIKLSEENYMLKRAVGYLQPEVQTLFFQKNINVYERNESRGLVLLSMDDSFQVIDKVLDRLVRNVYTNAQVLLPEEFAIGSDSQFIYDNDCDQLLIVIDNLIQVVETFLFDNLAFASRNMTIFLSISISLLGILVAYSFKYVIGIHIERDRFLRIFLTLSNREVKKIELMLSNFFNTVKEGSEVDRKSVLSDSNRFLPNLKTSVAASPVLESNNRSSLRRNFSETSLKRLNRRSWISLIHLNGAICGVLAFMLVYYARAVNEITTIENHQKNINSALENINRVTLLSAQIHALVMQNGTSTLRQKPILVALQEDLDNLKAVNDLLKNLRDKDGQLSDMQQKIFFNLSCTEAYTAKYLLGPASSTKTCKSLSKGSGHIALANLLPELSSNLAQLMLDFQSSNKTRTSLFEIYSQVSSTHLAMFDVCTILFVLSFDETVVEYQVLMKDLEDQRTILAWIAVVISFFTSVILWFWVIRKLIHKVFEIRDIMKLVPVKLILKNIALKKYIESL